MQDKARKKNPPDIEQRRVVAVIDIGSGSIRLVIAEVGPGRKIRHLENLQQQVPLGKDVFTSGRISTPTQRAAIAVLQDFTQVMEEYGLDSCHAIATAAVREASNRDNFIDQIFVRTGIDVEVIDGSEENRLEMIAVESALDGHVDFRKESCLILEVGSGSTVLIFLNQGEVEATRTLSIGSIKLPGNAIVGQLDAKAQQRAIKRSVNESADYIGRQNSLSAIKTFIAVGGEMRFLARQLDTDGGDGDDSLRRLKAEAVISFVKDMGRLAPEEIADRYALGYDEAERLLPALLYYRYFLRATGATEILVPLVSIRDGILREEAQILQGGEGTDVSRMVISSTKRLASKYAYDEPHALWVATLAGRLFDKLREDHGLGSRERLLLYVAAILHEIGMYISPSSRHKHSMYLIHASDIFGLRRQDKEIVANVARYHRGAMPRSTHVDYMSLSKQDRARVAKLAAILRVAIALDAQRAQRIREIEIDLGREPYEIWVPEDVGDISMERDLLRRKAKMFADVFGVDIVLRQGAKKGSR